MSGICRDNDTAGGDLIPSQTKVYANGEKVIVHGDLVANHGVAPHNAPTMVAGSNDVYVSGIAVCNANDLATCGHTATGSGDVGVGNVGDLSGSQIQDILAGILNGTISFNVTPQQTSVNEGSSVTFDITCGDMPDGTNLSWHTSGLASDFAVASGSAIMMGGSAEAVLSPLADSTTEGAESFNVLVYLNQDAGYFLGESVDVTINDTSQTYVPPPAPPKFNFGMQYQDDSGSWVYPQQMSGGSSNHFNITHVIPFALGGIPHSKNFKFRWWRTNSAQGTILGQNVRRPAVHDTKWSYHEYPASQEIVPRPVASYPGFTGTLVMYVSDSGFITELANNPNEALFKFMVWSLDGTKRQVTIDITLSQSSL